MFHKVRPIYLSSNWTFYPAQFKFSWNMKVILTWILDWWVCKAAPQCLYKWSQFLLIFNYEIEIWQIQSMQSWFLWRKPIKWLSSPRHPSFFEPAQGKLEKVYICDLSHVSVYFSSNLVFYLLVQLHLLNLKQNI